MMGGKRGFMFSIDATFAAAVLVIAASLMFIMFPVYEHEDASYKMVSLEAQDEARVNFYTGVQVSDTPDSDDSYYRCSEYFNFTGGYGDAKLERFYACEGIE